MQSFMAGPCYSPGCEVCHAAYVQPVTDRIDALLDTITDGAMRELAAGLIDEHADELSRVFPHAADLSLAASIARARGW